jgi:glyoxylate/succinic semialdehyde reductase
MSAAVKAAGGSFLEAPVSGSKGPAEQGALIFLTAGDETVKDAASADLEAMGKAVRMAPVAAITRLYIILTCRPLPAARLQTFYFGPEVGRGSRMKLVVNMIMGIQLNALAEGIALTEASDLPVDELLEILSLGAMASPMIGMKGPAMAKRSYGAPMQAYADRSLGLIGTRLIQI